MLTQNEKQKLSKEIALIIVAIGGIVTLSYALELTIKFFEQKEEYEKCAHLKQIQDVVEKFAK